jgi:hypothetical protein
LDENSLNSLTFEAHWRPTGGRLAASEFGLLLLDSLAVIGILGFKGMKLDLYGWVILGLASESQPNTKLIAFI